MSIAGNVRTLLSSTLIALAVCAFLGLGLARARAEPEWTTYHRDQGRSGFDSETSGPVEPSFGWQSPDLGAPIWSQPLILGSTVYVATVGDELYALNSSTGAVEWHVSAGVPVPAGDLPCGDIQPTVGIVSTPVIDVAKQEIFVVADTWDQATEEAKHLLEGFSLANGSPLLSMPVDPPQADPKALLQRTALNLDGERIIFGFGGNDGDCSDYRGAVVSAPESGTGKALFWQAPIALPSLWGGAVWAPSGPAVDGSGFVYATTGNPVPPEGEEATTFDYSDAVVKLDPATSFVANPMTEPETPLGWFEPPNWQEESNNDEDLSSAGAELLPGGLLFQAGKDGVGYLIDEATMQSGAEAVYHQDVCAGYGSFGGDAYANGTIYVGCTTGVQALAYDESERKFTPLWQGPSDAFGPPIVSGGLVWVVSTGGFKGGGTKLYGLDLATGAPMFTEVLPKPVADHFASPSAAGGELLVSTGQTVTAYKLTPAAGSEGPGLKSANEASTPKSTVAGSKGTSQEPVGSSIRTTTKSTPSTLRLLHSKLRRSKAGRIGIKLRCLTANPCAGRAILRATITLPSDGMKGQRRRVNIKLAEASFKQANGTFTVTLDLGKAARVQLHRHARKVAFELLLLPVKAEALRMPVELS